MKKVGIIGFGRFGKVLASILKKGFSIYIYDRKNHDPHHGVEFTDINKFSELNHIFIAVPIRQFEKVIKKIIPILKPKTTLIDVCSVKIYPQNIMKKHLPKHCGYISSHPMFGPDSFRSSNNLKMMMHPSIDRFKKFDFWKNFFSAQGIQIINITAEEHDKHVARSQGVTHFLGRSLKDYGIKQTNLDTQGFSDLIDLVQQTCNDSWELYEDLQSFNPFTKSMLEDIIIAIKKNQKKILKINHA